MLRQNLLFRGWILSFVLALVCGAVVLQGVRRDTRAGEPVLCLDLTQPSGWSTASFRVWGKERYQLFVSSVNHDPKPVGHPYAGVFAVEILSPDGTPYYQRTFAGSAIDHRVPDNYGDTKLAVLELDGWPFQVWTLRARVVEPDAQFTTPLTQLKFWQERADLGMGGLMNYAFIVPTALLLAIALGLAIWLAATRSWIPLVLTVIAVIAALGFALI